MGSLVLPTTGMVYLDANCFIYSVERIDPYRAPMNLRTPDAIHAATALLNGCVLFVTNDGAFRRLSDLSVTLLNEIAL